MKVKMNKDALGSNDGIKVNEFKKGEVYTSPGQMSKSLADKFVERKIAVEIEIKEKPKTIATQPEEDKENGAKNNNKKIK